MGHRLPVYPCYSLVIMSNDTVDGCEFLHLGWWKLYNGINHLSTGAGFLPSTVGDVKGFGFENSFKSGFGTRKTSRKRGRKLES